jgi:hypothetical protein
VKTTTEKKEMKNEDTMDMVVQNCEQPEPIVLTQITLIVFRNIVSNPLCREMTTVISDLTAKKPQILYIRRTKKCTHFILII